MRKTLENQERLAGVDEALADIQARRPALADIAAARALIVKARLAASEALPKTSLLGAELDAAAFAGHLANGVPLLAPLLEGLGEPSAELVARLRTAARHVLPAAAQAFPNLAPELAQAAVRLEREEAFAAGLLRALAGAAEWPKCGIEISEGALQVAAGETLLAILAHEGVLLAGLADLDAWRLGYCPVCGGGADVGFMKEGKEDSEFLIAKAGQLWLHCGQCASLWRFARMRCVSCGCEDHARLELLVAGEGGQDHERAQLCQDCRRYLVTLSMVDRSERVNLEMLGVALLHLDLLAQEKGFLPLTPSPWNTLG